MLNSFYSISENVPPRVFVIRVGRVETGLSTFINIIFNYTFQIAREIPRKLR